MSRTLSTVAIFLALAGSAAAQEARVNVVGKDEATARHDIRQAVENVCKAADHDGAFQGAYTIQNCLMDGESRAMAQYRDYQRQAAVTPVGALASNDGASSHGR
jgi:hypothetical protein